MSLLPEVALPPHHTMRPVGRIVRVVHAHRPEGFEVVAAAELDVGIQTIGSVAVHFLDDAWRPFLGDLCPIKPRDWKLVDQRIRAGVRLSAGKLWKHRRRSGRLEHPTVFLRHRIPVRMHNQPPLSFRGLFSQRFDFVQADTCRRVGRAVFSGAILIGCKQSNRQHGQPGE